MSKVLDHNGNEVIGFFRSEANSELMVALSEPAVSVPLGDMSIDNEKALLGYADKLGENMVGSGWYIDVTGGIPDMPTGGDDNPEPVEGDGTGEPDGEREAEGDGTGDGSGQGDNDGDPEEGDADDNAEEAEMREFNVEDRDQTGEDESTGNEMVDDIWELLKPKVVGLDQSTGTLLADIVADYVEARLENVSKNVPGETPDGDYKAPRFEGDVPKAPKGAQGEHMVYRKLLNLIARRLHVYLPGIPGVGKSHMAEQAARTLGLEFGAISFSPQSTESKLLGYLNAHGDYIGTIFRQLYEFGGVFLMDELDNANGAVIAVMNGGLAQEFMAFPDGMVKRHPDFICIATANTFGTGPTAEFAGRQKMDAATLNRFVKLEVPNDDDIENAIVADILGEDLAGKWLAKVRHVRNAVADLRIKTFVTMRDSINGAKMIQPGPGKFTQAEALEMTCMCLLTDDQKKKVKAWKPV